MSALQEGKVGKREDGVWFHFNKRRREQAPALRGTKWEIRKTGGETPPLRRFMLWGGRLAVVAGGMLGGVPGVAGGYGILPYGGSFYWVAGWRWSLGDVGRDSGRREDMESSPTEVLFIG